MCLCPAGNELEVKATTFEAIIRWFGHASEINDASDDIDKATSSLMFGSAWVLASSCAVHYFWLFGSPGHVGGGHICRCVGISFKDKK
jgi:hypothetical protein